MTNYVTLADVITFDMYMLSTHNIIIKAIQKETVIKVTCNNCQDICKCRKITLKWKKMI